MWDRLRRFYHPNSVPLHRVRFHFPRWRYHARQAARRWTKHAPWSRIRVVGNAPVVRVAAAIPFVGYIILLNERIYSFTQVHSEFSVFSKQAPWNLLLLYFGSIFTGLGAIVYAARCPAFLKRYEIFADYRNQERELWRDPVFSRQKLSLMQEETRRDVPLESGFPGMLTSRTHRAVTDLEKLITDPNQIDTCLFSEWQLFDRSRPGARLFCTVFYALGLVTLAEPSLLTFLKVASFTLKRLWDLV